MARIRRHVTFANALSCVCLFIVLGGTSAAGDVLTAASKLITGKQVKNRSLTGADIKLGSLTGAEVKDGSLARADFSGSVVGPAGATGDTGARGEKGDPGPTGQIQGATAGGDLTGTYPNPTIAPGKVTSSSIFDGTIAAVDLADAAVTAAKIAPLTAFVSAGLTTTSPFCQDPNNQSLGNAWGTMSPNVNNEVGYQRDPFGIVHVRGIALRCGTAGNPVFPLPAGFRPGGEEVHAVMHASGAARRLDIEPDGSVNVNVLPAAGEWISLDGITFRCAPSVNGCP